MIKFLKIFDLKYAFVLSIILGIIIWMIFYMVLPIHTSRLSFETFSYISTCVLCFIVGYYMFSFNKTQKLTTKPINYFIILTVIVSVGLAFRYIDLFLIRDIKWNNSYHTNKLLKSANASNPNLIITLLGTLRVLYVIPILILTIEKSRNKGYWFAAFFLIVLGSIEVFLFGTRKPFFTLLFFVLIALFYFNRKKVMLSKKNILIMISVVFLLGFFSYFILNSRMSENSTEENALVKVLDARYNDFVKIKDHKLNQFKENPNSLRTKAQIMFIHTGQYVVHGIFELDYIVNNNFPKAMGLYSFNPFYKLLNRLQITKKDLSTIDNHRRDYVYTTFFGSFFIDFGWFTLVIMFLFGVFQRWVSVIAQSNIIAKVFFVILVCVNITMPIFNLLHGAGLYLFIFMLTIMCFSLKKQAPAVFSN